MMFASKLIVFFLWTFIYYESSESETPTSGPYRSYLIAVRKCNKTTYPQHPNPTIVVNIEMFNFPEGNGLRGSWEVINNTSAFKIKTKSLIWERGKWKSNYQLVDNGCRGSLMPYWLALFNIKLNKQKCALLKCRIPFTLVNLNKAQHIITQTAEYGRVLWINEMFNVGKQYKTLFCYEYESLIEPL